MVGVRDAAVATSYYGGLALADVWSSPPPEVDAHEVGLGPRHLGMLPAKVIGTAALVATDQWLCAKTPHPTRSRWILRGVVGVGYFLIVRHNRGLH